MPAFMGSVDEENKAALFGSAVHRFFELVDFTADWVLSAKIDDIKAEIERQFSEGFIR